MKRMVLLFLLLFAALLLPASALAAQEYYAQRFDVDLSLQPDGALLVTETVQFSFSGDPFTFVFRDLEYNELDAIDQIQVYMDGQRLPEGTGPGQAEITSSRPTRVTWHFAPTTDSSHTFSLSYRVLGAVRDLAEADRLVWRAIPETHEYPIRASVITLEYPPTTTLLAPPSLRGAEGRLESGQNRATFYVQDIGPDTAVDITASFQPGSLVQAPPAWQAAQIERQQQIRQAVPVGLGVGGLLLAAGIVALYLLNNRLRGDRPRPATARPTSPPSPLPPGLAAQLIGSDSQALGTLFDLAQRGYLRIEEGPKRWGSRTYELVRLPEESSDLNAHEQGLLQAIFEKGRGEQARVSLSEVGNRLAQRSKLYLEPLETEMLSRGWLDPQRKARNNRLLIPAVIIAILSALVLVAGFLQFANPMLAAPLLGAGAAGILISTIALIYFAGLSSLTDEGERRRAAWRGFADYLKDVTRSKEPALRPDAFELYLPYAASFGLAQQWAKHFEKRDGVPIPAWFQALERQADFSDITAVIIASTAASSAAASSAAAAGGASGGGASGAG